MVPKSKKFDYTPFSSIRNLVNSIDVAFISIVFYKDYPSATTSTNPLKIPASLGL